MSSSSSSVLRMGQGFGFGRVNRRASSQGHFLWDWYSRRGSSSASRWGGFAVEPRSLSRDLGGCLSLWCCAWRVRDARPWVVVVLREGYAIPVACLPSCSFFYSACWWFRVGLGFFLFLCFVLSLAVLWLCVCSDFLGEQLVLASAFCTLVRCLALALRSNLFVSGWFYGTDTLSFHFRVSAWFFLSM